MIWSAKKKEFEIRVASGGLSVRIKGGGRRQESRKNRKKGQALGELQHELEPCPAERPEKLGKKALAHMAKREADAGKKNRCLTGEKGELQPNPKTRGGGRSSVR